MATETRRNHFVDRLTAYAEQNDENQTEELSIEEDLDIPEDLSTLDNEGLNSLHERAISAFDELYAKGDLSDDDFATLAELTEVIEALQAELAEREAAANARAEKAAELAAKIGRNTDALASDEGDDEASEDEESDEDDSTEELASTDETEADAAEEVQEEATAVTASASNRPRSIRVPLSSVARSTTSSAPKKAAKPSAKDFLVASGDGLGQSVGAAVDFVEAGEMLDRRLNSFARTQYEAANKAGRQISERHSLISIQRNIPEDLQVKSNDPDHVREVFDRAGDEKRLKNGSLVAAGGWCAPSEIDYSTGEEVETRQGLLSVPEIGVPRGGISFTTGINFADLYAQVAANSFSFTEEQDIAGEYAPGENPGDPNVAGDKPCFRIECPDFEEYRLDVDGLCVTAGILQSRGYPEVQARTLRGVLVAHDHLLNGKMISQMASGSTAVTLPATQVGTAAPVLTAIELQVEHYRASRRMSRTATLEAVFPFWIRGAIRSDLSRRLGVDLLSVPDARIDAWFRERGIAPQFVYNWQAIDTTAAAAFNAWPTTVSFLLYAAGTWVKGINDLITLDTLYDSVLLGQNDFTALFTEEGWFVAKRGQDSRMVTTSITADGAAHIGVEIEHNGTLAIPAGE